MALLQNICLLLALLFIKTRITNAAVCLSDNIQNGNSAIFKYDCPESFNTRFQYRTYSGNFTNPIGSDHYMTTSLLENNCGMSDVIPATAGNQIVLNYYTYNGGVSNPRCNLNYIGSSFGGITIDITDTNQWINATLTIENSGFVQFVLDCGYFNADQFFAVGNIFILANSEADCPPIATTTTTPEITTTRTTIIDFTTTTEGTTTQCTCVC